MLYCPMNSGYKQGYEVQYPSKDGQVPGLLVSIMKLRHSHFLAPPQGPWKDSCYLEVTASSMTGGSRWGQMGSNIQGLGHVSDAECTVEAIRMLLT